MDNAPCWYDVRNVKVDNVMAHQGEVYPPSCLAWSASHGPSCPALSYL